MGIEPDQRAGFRYREAELRAADGRGVCSVGHTGSLEQRSVPKRLQRESRRAALAIASHCLAMPRADSVVGRSRRAKNNHHRWLPSANCGSARSTRQRADRGDRGERGDRGDRQETVGRGLANR